MDKSELLFYSNRCQHSRAVLELLQSRGLGNRFMLVCVDAPTKYALPPFVDRVPLVYRRQTRQVLTEASIPHFINTLGTAASGNGRQQANAQAQGGQQQQQDGELMAYTDFVTSGKFSDSFGFLDDADTGGRVNGSYNFIAGQQQQHDMPAGLETQNMERASKFDQHQYDSYISRRDADLNSIRAAQPRPIG